MKTKSSTIFIAGAPTTQSLRATWHCGQKVWRTEEQEFLFFTAPYNCSIGVFEICVMFDDLRLGVAFIKLQNPGVKKLKTGDVIRLDGALKLDIRRITKA